MKLIKIKTDHYVVVDDSEIKENCWALHMDPLGGKEIVTANGQCKLDKKITHSTEPLDKSLFFTDRVWGCERLSLGEVKELIGEVDVEKKAYEYAINDFDDYAFCGYVKGYNQALEDNKEKKYTEEDLIKAVLLTVNKCDSLLKKSYGELEVDEIEIIKQIIQPKTEWEVELVDGKLKLI